MGTLTEMLAQIEASGRKYYIYILFRPCGTPFYVGKGRGDRIRLHERFAIAGRAGHKAALIRSIWRSNQHVGYRIEAWFDDENDAFAYEQLLIAHIGREANGGPLVNLTDGGEGPSGFRQVITPEMRAKISASLTGRTKSPEHVAKVAAKRRGQRHSLETRAKMSEAVNKPEAKAKIAIARRGFKQTAESNEKNRRAHLGKPLSAAHREAIGAAHRGMKRPQAFRERMREIALARPRKLGTATLGKPATTIQFSDTAAV
jgi:hypothetical protein